MTKPQSIQRGRPVCPDSHVKPLKDSPAHMKGMPTQPATTFSYSESSYNVQPTNERGLDATQQAAGTDPPSCLPMFQTAGMNAIAISEEGLSRANKLFAIDNNTNQISTFKGNVHNSSEPAKPMHDDSNCNSEQPTIISARPTMMLGFQAGGSGKAIAISNEQLAKASKIFDDNVRQDTGGTKFDEDQSFLGKAEVCGEMNDEQDNAVDTHTNAGSSSCLPTFRTAGRKSIIDVSEENLNKVAKLFANGSEASKSISSRGSAPSLHSFNPLGGDQSGNMASDAASAKSHNAILGFHLAGSKKTISCSDEQIEEAARLLKDNDASATRVDAQNEKLRSKDGMYSPRNDIQQPSQLHPTFRTAGNNAAIAISEEGLAKAQTLFSTSNSLPEGENCANSNPPSCLPMFQTAGKNAAITISEEGLSRASKLFANTNNIMGNSTYDNPSSSSKGIVSSSPECGKL